MNPTVNELYAFLNEKIPSALSCEWDNDGLMVASDGSREVKKILLTLDVSKKTLNMAKARGCDAVISHHPLIFKPLKSVTEADTTADIVISAVKSDVAVMSFHTRLDALSGGVNDALCELIGVTDTVPFGPEGEKIGRLGTLSFEATAETLALSVKAALGADAVRLTAQDKSKSVKKIAVLGGGGKDFVLPAVRAGADVLITGEIGYNTGVTAEDAELAVIEAGHYFTEAPVLERLRSMIAEAYPSVSFEFFVSNPTQTY